MLLQTDLALRLKKAYDALSAEQKGRVLPTLLGSHQRGLGARRLAAAPPPGAGPAEHTLVYSVLHDDPHGLLRSIEEKFEPHVGSDGVIWGPAKYEGLDPGWLYAGAVWLENFDQRHPFPAGTPVVAQMPDPARIALIGDWGTGSFGSGTAPALKIAGLVRASAPDYTIHLGDVYYAGSASEEQANFIAPWPRGRRGSFALNSNHEMYSQGGPYISQALPSAAFGDQDGLTYFALENASWIVVGLDTAYYSDVAKAYMDGSLGPSPQAAFIAQLAAKGKKMILLSHHNGLGEDGSAPNGLWDEVMAAFPSGAAPACWYWGHVHAGIVYTPQGPSGVKTRCVGHSAVPWGLPSMLQGAPHVQWFDMRRAPGEELRLLNGYAALELDGPTLTETFIDENGGTAWSARS